jgi:phage baseplate assembly protein W
MAMSIEPIRDVDRENGDLIWGWRRIRQSIYTILTTRLRTRLMRLWWGSEYLNLQDKPATQEVFMRSIVAAAKAINLYEPEFKVTKIAIDELGPDGRVAMTIYGDDIFEKAARKVEVTF